MRPIMAAQIIPSRKKAPFSQKGSHCHNPDGRCRRNQTRGHSFQSKSQKIWSTTMLILSAVAIGVSLPAFALGWFNGYSGACRAHGWYLPKFHSDDDAVKPQ